MRRRRLWPILGRTGAVYLLALVVLVGGLLLDVFTPQLVVVAILYSIPVALSGLAGSARFTAAMVVAALAANAFSGYLNAAGAPLDSVAVINRGLAAVSVLLVGALVWRLRATTIENERLVAQDERVRRERQLRVMVERVASARGPEAIVDAGCAGLRSLLAADAVLIAEVEGDRYGEIVAADPPSAAQGRRGAPVPWVVSALRDDMDEAMLARSDADVVGAARWRRGRDAGLTVVVLRPTVDGAREMLSLALFSLNPVLERACLLREVEALTAASAPR